MAEAKIFETFARALLMPQIGPYNTEISGVDQTRVSLDTDPSLTSTPDFTLDAGSAVVYDETLKLNALRSDLTFYPVPFDKLVTQAVANNRNSICLPDDMVFKGAGQTVFRRA